MPGKESYHMPSVYQRKQYTHPFLNPAFETTPGLLLIGQLQLIFHFGIPTEHWQTAGFFQ